MLVGFSKTDLMYATKKCSTGALPSLSPCCHDNASSVSETAMTAGWVGGDGGMHVSDGAGRSESVLQRRKRRQDDGLGHPNTGTVRSGADVPGHARPPLPCPPVRADADPVLGVHFQVGDLHVLRGGVERISRSQGGGGGERGWGGGWWRTMK